MKRLHLLALARVDALGKSKSIEGSSKANSSLAMLELIIAVSEIFARFEVTTDMVEEDMSLVDTFNGAPKAANVWMTFREV